MSLKVVIDSKKDNENIEIFVRKQNVRIKSETNKIKSETKTAFSLVKVLQPFDDKRLLPQKLAKGFRSAYFFVESKMALKRHLFFKAVNVENLDDGS